MTVDAKDVYQILTNDGTIKFGQGNVRYPGNGGIKASDLDRVKGNYYDCKATIDRNSNSITLVAQESDFGVNAVNVVYEGDHATLGDLMPPGYMYSDGFAGCDFFLYRGASGAVTGVHASRELYKFRDPQPYFSRRGVFEPLWHWKSKDVIEEEKKNKSWFGAVFLVIDRHQINCYALALKNQQVMDILAYKELKNWL